MWLRSVKIFLVISIVKGRLVSLANAYNLIELIKFKEKILLMTQIKAGRYA